MKNKMGENKLWMNSVWAAFGPRAQPVGSAQLAATQPDRATARRGMAQRARGRRSPRPAWPGWHGQQELTGGSRVARLVGEVDRASSVAPGKEIDMAAHHSGRLMLRW
jgi:hypothetical protein